MMDSTAAGCIVKLVPDGELRESRARRIFYPWSAVRSIELLEDLHEPRRPPALSRPFEPPEYPATLRFRWTLARRRYEYAKRPLAKSSSASRSIRSGLIVQIGK